MKNLWEEKDGVFEVSPGAEINRTIQEAIELSRKEGVIIAFDFNGVLVKVQADSDPILIYRDWHRAMNGYIEKVVEPDPIAELSEAAKANDAEIEAQNEAARQKSQAAYDTKMKAKEEAVNAKLADTPAVEWADEAAWKATVAKNQDGYGGAVMTYADRWARLMQYEMSQGNPLADIADTASHEADIEGITGFMYGCAVSILAKCWKHGEELRRWHNIKTQINKEGEKANEVGGVLNPAMLSIGG